MSSLYAVSWLFPSENISLWPKSLPTFVLLPSARRPRLLSTCINSLSQQVFIVTPPVRSGEHTLVELTFSLGKTGEDKQVLCPVRWRQVLGSKEKGQRRTQGRVHWCGEEELTPLFGLSGRPHWKVTCKSRPGGIGEFSMWWGRGFWVEETGSAKMLKSLVV